MKTVSRINTNARERFKPPIQCGGHRAVQRKSWIASAQASFHSYKRQSASRASNTSSTALSQASAHQRRHGNVNGPQRANQLHIRKKNDRTHSITASVVDIRRCSQERQERQNSCCIVWLQKEQPGICDRHSFVAYTASAQVA